jgi:hypothetical protein
MLNSNVLRFLPVRTLEKSVPGFPDDIGMIAESIVGIWERLATKYGLLSIRAIHCSHRCDIPIQM